MSKDIQTEMEIRFILNLMNLTLDSEEWVELHNKYLELKQELEWLYEG